MAQGYSIVTAAEGVEMLLRKERQTVAVQCKHRKTRRVSVEAVRELNATMKLNGAAAGFVVTTGRFSREAQAFAHLINVKLVDPVVLHGLLQKSRPAH